MQEVKNQGFSLVELVVVIVIGMVLLAIGIPFFSKWVSNIRLNTATRDLFSTMQKAKLEAAKRNVNSAVTFNQDIDGTNYVYVLYSDTNKNCEYDTGDKVLHTQTSWPVGVSYDLTKGGGDGLTFTNNDDGNPTIVFLPTTIPTANGGGVGNGSAYLINTNDNEHSVVVSQAGMVRID